MADGSQHPDASIQPNTVAVNLVVQGASGHSENLGCPFGVAPAALQRRANFPRFEGSHTVRETILINLRGGGKVRLIDLQRKPFRDGPQFAHIARPWTTQEALTQGIIDGRNRKIGAAGGFSYEMREDQGNIIPGFTQGR